MSLQLALSAAALSLVALLTFGSIFASSGAVGLLLMQLSAFAAPALVAATAARPDSRRALGLTSTTRGMWLATALVALTFWVVNAAIIAPLGLKLFGGDEALEQLRRGVASTPIVLLLLGQALVPSICEELFFRGLLARSLARKLPLWLAIVFAAALFALAHSPAAKMLPALATGLVLGCIALCSGSTLAAMLAHAINNAIVLAFAAVAAARDAFTVSPFIVVAAAITSAVALRWIIRNRVIR